MADFNKRLEAKRDHLPDEDDANLGKYYRNKKGFDNHKSIEYSLKYRKKDLDAAIDQIGEKQGISVFELAFINQCYLQVIESRQVTRWSFAVLQAMAFSKPEGIDKLPRGEIKLKEQKMKEHDARVDKIDQQIVPVLQEVHELTLQLHKLLGMLFQLEYRKNEVHILKELKERIGDPHDLITGDGNRELFNKFKIEAINMCDVLKKKTEAFGELVYGHNVV